MIRRIQALNYRCLRYIDLELDRFHVAVGPNASGKSTLFDVVAFLGDMIRDGPKKAIDKRGGNFQDLVWNRPKRELGFELAVEFEIPADIRARLPRDKAYCTFRYEAAVREGEDWLGIASERGLLISGPNESGTTGDPPAEKSRFPDPAKPPGTVFAGSHQGSTMIFHKSRSGKVTFRPEVPFASGEAWKGSIPPFVLGPRRSVLRFIPFISEPPDRFPMSSYVASVLESNIRFVFLDSVKMRESSLPGTGSLSLSEDGTNLPWVIKRLRHKRPDVYREWLEHVKIVLDDLDDIRVVEQPWNRSVYLMLLYKTGVEVPSWTVSDGTLRFLATTIIPYLSLDDQIYLLEEPENGLHLFALDAIYDSLWSTYESQVLVATHSPALLACASPEEALCFAKDDEGATDIVRGDQHPRLKDWRGAVDMSVLFATGVIG